MQVFSVFAFNISALLMYELSVFMDHDSAFSLFSHASKVSQEHEKPQENITYRQAVKQSDMARKLTL